MLRIHDLVPLVSGLGFALVFLSTASAASVEEQREENLRRLSQIKTATTLATPSTPSVAYVKKIAQVVRGNIYLDVEIEGNPTAVVRIETELDGRIRSRSLVQSSGVIEWDTAVLKAVDRTERLPIESNEVLPKIIELHSRPKE